MPALKLRGIELSAHPGVVKTRKLSRAELSPTLREASWSYEASGRNSQSPQRELANTVDTADVGRPLTATIVPA